MGPAGAVAAPGAVQAMHLVFRNLGVDRWQFQDWVPMRLEIIAAQGIAAVLAAAGLASNDLVGRQQGTLLLAMAGLPAACLTRRRFRWSALDRRTIAGRGREEFVEF